MRIKLVLRYLSRFGLLTLGIGMATLGLLGWQDDGFRWPVFGNGEPLLRFEPLYLLILGIAIVPPTLWDIFQLELERSGPPAGGNTAPSASGNGDDIRAPASRTPAAAARQHDDG